MQKKNILNNILIKLNMKLAIVFFSMIIIVCSNTTEASNRDLTQSKNLFLLHFDNFLTQGSNLKNKIEQLPANSLGSGTTQKMAEHYQELMDGFVLAPMKANRFEYQRIVEGADNYIESLNNFIAANINDQSFNNKCLKNLSKRIPKTDGSSLDAVNSLVSSNAASFNVASNNRSYSKLRTNMNKLTSNDWIGEINSCCKSTDDSSLKSNCDSSSLEENRKLLTTSLAINPPSYTLPMPYSLGLDNKFVTDLRNSEKTRHEFVSSVDSIRRQGLQGGSINERMANMSNASFKEKQYYGDILHSCNEAKLKASAPNPWMDFGKKFVMGALKVGVCGVLPYYSVHKMRKDAASVSLAVTDIATPFLGCDPGITAEFRNQLAPSFEERFKIDLNPPWEQYRNINPVIPPVYSVALPDGSIVSVDGIIPAVKPTLPPIPKPSRKLAQTPVVEASPQFVRPTGKVAPLNVQSLTSVTNNVNQNRTRNRTNFTQGKEVYAAGSSMGRGIASTPRNKNYSRALAAVNNSAIHRNTKNIFTSNSPGSGVRKLTSAVKGFANKTSSMHRRLTAPKIASFSKALKNNTKTTRKKVVNTTRSLAATLSSAQLLANLKKDVQTGQEIPTTQPTTRSRLLERLVDAEENLATAEKNVQKVNEETTLILANRVQSYLKNIHNTIIPKLNEYIKINADIFNEYDQYSYKKRASCNRKEIDAQLRCGEDFISERAKYATKIAKNRLSIEFYQSQLMQQYSLIQSLSSSGIPNVPGFSNMAQLASQSMNPFSNANGGGLSGFPMPNQMPTNGVLPTNGSQLVGALNNGGRIPASATTGGNSPLSAFTAQNANQYYTQSGIPAPPSFPGIPGQARPPNGGQKKSGWLIKPWSNFISLFPNLLVAPFAGAIDKVELGKNKIKFSNKTAYQEYIVLYEKYVQELIKISSNNLQDLVAHFKTRVTNRAVNNIDSLPANMPALSGNFLQVAKQELEYLNELSSGRNAKLNLSSGLKAEIQNSLAQLEDSGTQVAELLQLQVDFETKNSRLIPEQVWLDFVPNLVIYNTP